MSEAAMSDAAAALRSAQAVMASTIGVLTDAWSGPDSDRFAADWRDQVSSPLLSAAAALEGAAFTEL
jgi:hypothetical protein